MDFITPTEYMFKVKVYVDDTPREEYVFTNIHDAFKTFDQAKQNFDFEKYYTYTLTEPNGRQSTKTIYKDGRVAIK